jgi:hypothetical protein
MTKDHGRWTLALAVCAITILVAVAFSEISDSRSARATATTVAAAREAKARVSFESQGAVLVNGAFPDQMKREGLFAGDLIETKEGGARIRTALAEYRLGASSLGVMSDDLVLYLKSGKALVEVGVRKNTDDTILLTPHLVLKCSGGRFRVGVDPSAGTTVKVDSGMARVTNRLVDERIEAGQGISVSSSGKPTELRGESMVFGKPKDFLDE